MQTEFEERLQELAPLPDILKATQSRLQEEKQVRIIAERTCADLSHELSVTLERVRSTNCPFQTEQSLKRPGRLVGRPRQCCGLPTHQAAAAAMHWPTLCQVAGHEKEMNSLRAQQHSWLDERQSLLSHIDAYERKCSKLKDDIKWYK